MDSLKVKRFAAERICVRKKKKMHGPAGGHLIRSELRAILLMWSILEAVAGRLPESAMIQRNEHSSTLLKDMQSEINVTPLDDGDVFMLDSEPGFSEGQHGKDIAEKRESYIQGNWKQASVNNGLREESSDMSITEVKQSKSRRRKKQVAVASTQQQRSIEHNEGRSRNRVGLAGKHGRTGSSYMDIDPSEKNLSSSIDKARSQEKRKDHGASDTSNSDDTQMPAGKVENPPALDGKLKQVQEKDAPTQADTDLVPRHSFGQPITDWDAKRQVWLERHPQIGRYTEDGKLRMFILTGSQPSPCLNPKGDHLLLRCFKNKVDYARLHGIEIFYNMALLHPDMPTFWAKLPLVRATMRSHPEVEWIWWVDADAIVTDMEFEVPLERYKDHNLVVCGWEGLIYEKRSWLGLNAGSFLIRNCQWSMDFMERWASMGPQGPLGEASGEVLSDFLPDRPRNPTDDQAALVYILIKEREEWGGKVFIEASYYLHGYWLDVVDGYESIEQRYEELEREAGEQLGTTRRDATHREEKLAQKYADTRAHYIRNLTMHQRRPFVTHFTGCQPCSGHHNKIYDKDQCVGGLERALNYGDDQVLRNYGFKHHTLEKDEVKPIP